jgi:hypothetical protein
MTLTRRARGAWPIVGAVIALGASGPAPFQELPPSRAPAARPAATASIAGRISASDTRPLQSGTVILTPLENDGVPVVSPENVRIGADGSFSFAQVPPGRYRISARAVTNAKGPALFATFVVFIEGRDVDNLQLTLRPGGTLDGQVTLAAEHTEPSPALSALRVRAPSAEGGLGDALTGKVQADGRFVLRDLMTGDHQIVVDNLPSPWVVKSVVLRGRDIADAGIEVLEGDQLREARITITDHASELSGRVHEHGMPVADTTVLVYPVTPQFWLRTHRRMRLTRTDAEGRFRVRGLPEGEYLAIASSAIDEGDLGRRDRLESIRALTTPVSIDGPEARVTIELPLITAVPRVPVTTR